MSSTSCKHPLKAFTVGVNPSGKDKLKITSYDVDYVLIDHNEIVSCHQGNPHPVFFGRYKIVSDFQEIPCGHCISCRLKYSRDWANRMLLESMEHEHNYFLTLTYDNEHLPKPNEMIDIDTGEYKSSPINPLVKRDLQLFLKRLRKHYSEQKIRFYACGEYGSQSMRPHYHLILFGLDLGDDIEFFMKSSQGFNYYKCPTLERIWSKGNILVCDADWECMAYTARYVTKKLCGEHSEVYNTYNFPREFSTMSRKPGIARDYYENHKEQIYDTNEIIVGNKKGSFKFNPPKYYDKLFDIEYPECYNELKEVKKEISKANNKLKSSLTSLDYLSQLEVEEEILTEKIKSLKRKGVV